MILVDTSVWIDYFRGVNSPEARWLSSSIANDADLCICGMVLTEILQGIGSESQHRKVRQSLKPLLYMPTSQNAYYLAADIYRAARKQGCTIRNTVDCIIAACAITNNARLVQKDKDYLTIASVSKLELIAI